MKQEPAAFVLEQETAIIMKMLLYLLYTLTAFERNYSNIKPVP
jgi:hypothetical protein